MLTDAAIPNTLSQMGGRPASVQVGTRPGPTGSSTPWLATGATTARPRSRVSLGTVIFLGFLAITGFRLVGEFVRGLQTERPVVTSPADAGQAPEAGAIVFGSSSDGNCGVSGSKDTFAPGSEVWWTANLSIKQGPDASVVVITRRDGAELERETIPPDPSIGAWAVLCSGKPITQWTPGLYRVEVWDPAITTLLSVGEYRIAAP